MTLRIREDGTPDARARGPTALTADRPREYFCPECSARCTRREDKPDVGHRYGCPERSPTLPRGDSSQYERYKRTDR